MLHVVWREASSPSLIIRDKTHHSWCETLRKSAILGRLRSRRYASGMSSQESACELQQQHTDVNSLECEQVLSHLRTGTSHLQHVRRLETCAKPRFLEW